MNVYYIGSIPVSDELYHHGILGQKWGVRRYQNPDGTLTPAGRKRYGYGISEHTDTGGSGGTSRAHYRVGSSLQNRDGTLTALGKERYESDKEQKKLADKIIKGRTNIRKTPQVKHAAEELKDVVNRIQDTRKKYDEEVDKFYNDKKLFDEYSEKAVDMFLRDYPTVAEEYRKSRPLTSRFKEMNDRDLVKWLITNDDWGEGYYDPFTIFKESGDKRAKALLDADEKYFDSQLALSKASRAYTKSFIGEYGDLKYTRAVSGIPGGIEDRVADSLQNVIYYSAIEKHTGKKYI